MRDYPPLEFQWSGAVMVPLQSHLALKYYRTDQVYTLGHFEERSGASHKHQFAWLRAAWATLPDHLAEDFPTPEHLRSYALIRAGYCNTYTLVCDTEADAQRFAAFLIDMHDFDVVRWRGRTVKRWVAKSQKLKRKGGKDGMDAVEFYQSKEAILEVIKRLLGVDDIEDLRSAQDT
jgi:hypothetical protein